MVTVKVYYKSSGTAARSCRVGLSVGAIGGVYHEYTNDTGEAHFPNASPAQAEIYAEGKVVFKGYVSATNVVYI